MNAGEIRLLQSISALAAVRNPASPKRFKFLMEIAPAPETLEQVETAAPSAEQIASAVETAPVEAVLAEVAPSELASEPAQPATETAVDAALVASPENAPPVVATENAPPVAAAEAALGDQVAPTKIVAEPAALTSALPKAAQKTPQYVKAKDYLASQTKVYDHLSHVVLKILQLKPNDPLDEFESISKQVKFERGLLPSDASAQVTLENTSHLAHEKIMGLCLENSPTKMDAISGDLPDILDLANVFAWAGVSFGTEETYRLFMAIKKLVAKNDLKSIRFFGKITGTVKDYLIVESDRTEEAEDSDEPIVGFPPKEVGSGINKYVYFVCTDVTGDWTRLPDAKPQTIQQARSIRKLFSGNLDAKIQSYPPFNGTEADYLRAQIARISSATVISPNGYYVLDDGSEEDAVLNPDFEWPSNEALSQAETWVHHMPYILPQGRAKYEKPVQKKKGDELNNDDEEDELDEDEDQEEQGPAVLTPISEDSSMEGDISAWTVKLCSQLVPMKHCPVVARNNRWHGAFTVGYNDRFANIYVGWGLKDLGKPFVAGNTGLVCSEYLNIEEDPENPDVKVLKELLEQNDPTIEEEAQAQKEIDDQLALQKAQEAPEATADEEAEEPEEE